MRWLVSILLLMSLLAGCTSSNLIDVPVTDQAKYQYTPKIYTVQKGDTLYGISWAFGLDYKQIAQWNGINPPYTIHIGDQIHLYSQERNNTANTKPVVLTSLPRQIQPVKTKVVAAAPAGETIVTPTAPVSGKWSWPAQGSLVGKFSPKAGNKGIQIAGAEGSPIRATSSGQVVYAGEGLRGYGKLIIIKHSPEYISAYAHNREILVREGQAINSGQQIASMGQTDTNRPMLHFEIRKSGNPVDPVKLLNQL
ncbi:MAG: peptidoglycan DD-metalloendopeptidase family protein [Gammaproteobacteria bacterium]|nr:peptidoglycan DD-metalloendopeptidase family protein [Gammaproteobacteria bacterium]